MPKPLLQRLAPVLLTAYLLYSGAFLFMAIESKSIGIGDTHIPWGSPAAGVLAVLALELVVYAVIALGFWRERRWARPLMVWEGLAFLLLLLLIVPAGAHLEIVTTLPRVILVAVAAFAYLYWKPNVQEYYNRGASQ